MSRGAVGLRRGIFSYFRKVGSDEALRADQAERFVEVVCQEVS